MYELTTTLTTIAACSASIVAILGGFIASKLLSINTERDESEKRLSEIDEEIEFHAKELDTALAEINEEDALDFISINIQSVIDGKCLSDVYKEENHPAIEKDILSQYWEKALTIASKLQKYYESDDMQLNEGNIPIAAAVEFTSSFEYRVCEELCSEITKTEFSFLNTSLTETREIAFRQNMWYQKAQERVIANQSNVDWLQLQRKQLFARHKALQHPKGIKLGFLIFALFSLFNIVLPLILSPYSTTNHHCFIGVKVLAISLFLGGLLVILGYLIYLFRWNGGNGTAVGSSPKKKLRSKVKTKNQTTQTPKQCHKQLQAKIKSVKKKAREATHGDDNEYVKKATEDLTELYGTKEFSANQSFLLTRYIRLNSKTPILQVVFVPVFLTILIELAMSLFGDGLLSFFEHLKMLLTTQPPLDTIQKIAFGLATTLILIMFAFCVWGLFLIVKWLSDLVSPNIESVIEQNELNIVRMLLRKHRTLLEDVDETTTTRLKH